ncbi:hypothetical protein B0A63_11190 [Flavobacterium johnsoniae UW101]|nr:hypothetical protein B0A63_11190 [Flavobacterium johnsoniae UW101]
MLFYYSLESADLVLGWMNPVSVTARGNCFGMIIVVDCVYYYFLGAFSRCSLQSFVPNTGTKGFPLPSGLVLYRTTFWYYAI